MVGFPPPPARARSVRAHVTLGTLLLGLVALSAAANSNYTETALNGNLQDQCTAFTGTLVMNTSLTVAAECNKEDEDAPGTIDSEREDASIDLSEHVVWNASSRSFTWDGTVIDLTNLNQQCAVQGFTYSSSDVTLGLNCKVAVVNENCPTNTLAEVDPTGAITACWYAGSLPLNAKMTADTDGTFGRR